MREICKSGSGGSPGGVSPWGNPTRGPSPGADPIVPNYEYLGGPISG
ncbi:MAG: hypothetical protein RJA70_368 [Pseudomonadota bacterium]|jgi:hypothetical protein